MVCVQIKKSLIIAHVLADSSDPIANLLEHHAIARLAEMEEPASIPMTEQTLDAAVRPARDESGDNKSGGESTASAPGPAPAATKDPAPAPTKKEKRKSVLNGQRKRASMIQGQAQKQVEE